MLVIISHKMSPYLYTPKTTINQIMKLPFQNGGQNANFYVEEQYHKNETLSQKNLALKRRSKKGQHVYIYITSRTS